ncbi:MAG: hypothetical protein ABJG88_02975 [Litorimonas sp.]
METMTFKTDFDQILSENELNALYEFSNSQGRPPSWSVVFCHDFHKKNARRADFTTYLAFKAIIGENIGKEWLESQKHRLLPPSKYSEIASMMAEIRCYGGLLQAGFYIEPVPTQESPTPDFKAKFENKLNPADEGREFYIEVAAKREDQKETQISEDVSKGLTPEGVYRNEYSRGNKKLTMLTREMHPFGKPSREKKNDSTQANAISRICAIKQFEKQVVEAEPTVLWIDFIDFDSFRGTTLKDHFGPLSVHIHNGTLISGVIWYAFYGWEGAPILEPHGHTEKKVEMGHDGRFNSKNKPSKFNGAIICIEGKTVFFENPVATNPLNQNELMMLHGLPSFDLNKSIASWWSGAAIKKVEHQTTTIKVISEMNIRPAAGHYGPLNLAVK